MGPRTRPGPRTLAVLVTMLTTVGLVATTGTASAFTYVTNSTDTSWGIQDAAPPGVDTGSIRATQLGTGVQAPYSTMLNGYGGIRVTVDTRDKHRFDGQLLRGFGLRDVGDGRFVSTQAVNLSGVKVTRTVDVREDSSWGRWLDTFTNTTGRPLTIEVAFGGQTGYGASGTTASHIVGTSSGDATVTAEDTWTATASGTAADQTTPGPNATVVGMFDRTGNWLRDTFTRPMGTEGHAANFPAYVNTLTIAPGHSASLLHFVVVGRPVTQESAQAELDVVSALAASLSADPDTGGLTRTEICSVVNLDLGTPAGCHGKGATRVKQPKAPAGPPAVTTSRYDVVDKTIQELQADMEAGRTTSVEITQAYLDRIAAYDTGQFAFNAYITVAKDALEQARAADAARTNGRTGALLGIPIAVKGLIANESVGVV